MDSIISQYIHIDCHELSNRFRSSTKTFMQWIYHYLTLRIHFNLFAMSVVALRQFRLIHCQHNSDLGDDFVNYYCLFNQTYVIHNGDHEFRTKWFGDTATSDWVLANLNQKNHEPNQPHHFRYFQSYYPHFIMIFCLLYCINYLINALRNFMNNEQTILLNRCGYYFEYTEDYRTIELEEIQNGGSQGYNTNFTKIPSWRCLMVFYDTEMIILIGILIQTLLLNYLLNGKFFRYGIWVLEHYLEHWSGSVYKNINYYDNQMGGPIDWIFPIFTKCTIETFGVSGSVILYDGLCMLKFNYVNRILFCFIWIWYFCLICSVLFCFIIKLSLLFSTKLRTKTLRSRLINQELRSNREVLTTLKFKIVNVDLRTFITINCLIERFGLEQTLSIILRRSFPNKIAAKNNDGQSSKLL